MVSVIEKVLLRKDAASVVVAIAAAMIAMQLVSEVTGPIANYLFASDSVIGSSSYSFANNLILPVGVFLLQVVGLELLLRAVIAGRAWRSNQVKK